jgi:hypothetical protein
MPGRDSTGPPGGGGYGRGGGTGRGAGRQARNRPGAGPGGDCLCPNCGARSPHKPGTPCTSLKCPQCGAGMIRG